MKTLKILLVGFFPVLTILLYLLLAKALQDAAIPPGPPTGFAIGSMLILIALAAASFNTKSRAGALLKAFLAGAWVKDLLLDEAGLVHEAGRIDGVVVWLLAATVLFALDVPLGRLFHRDGDGDEPATDEARDE